MTDSNPRDLLCRDCGHHLHLPQRCAWTTGAGTSATQCKCGIAAALPLDRSCGVALAACQNETGHSGDHWNAEIERLKIALRQIAGPTIPMSKRESGESSGTRRLRNIARAALVAFLPTQASDSK